MNKALITLLLWCNIPTIIVPVTAFAGTRTSTSRSSRTRISISISTHTSIHKRSPQHVLPLSLSSSSSSSSSSSQSQNENNENNEEKWTHSDIEWRLQPPEDTPLVDKLKLKAAAKAIRTQCLMNNEPVPPVLCPKGGKAVLEAYTYNTPNKPTDDDGERKTKKNKKVARFGITTTRGPPAPPIDETIMDVYNINPPMGGAGIGAIIYMFVEPEYRKLGIGELALEAIAAIQIVQNIDFTVLVADDDGSNKLIEWYERNGFTKAPKLQDMFGSPGGKYGVTMIRPTQVRSDIFAKCQIKWW